MSVLLFLQLGMERGALSFCIFLPAFFIVIDTMHTPCTLQSSSFALAFHKPSTSAASETERQRPRIQITADSSANGKLFHFYQRTNCESLGKERAARGPAENEKERPQQRKYYHTHTQSLIYLCYDII